MKLTFQLLLLFVSTICFGQFNKKIRSNQINYTNTYNPLPDSLKGYKVIDQPTAPKNGMAGFYKYISKNIKCPRDARKADIKGRVFVEFVVGIDGAIVTESVKVVKGLHESCDMEAIRLIQKCKPWYPGMSEGKPVSQKIVLPIMFACK